MTCAAANQPDPASYYARNSLVVAGPASQLPSASPPAGPAPDRLPYPTWGQPANRPLPIPNPCSATLEPGWLDPNLARICSPALYFINKDKCYKMPEGNKPRNNWEEKEESRMTSQIRRIWCERLDRPLLALKMEWGQQQRNAGSKEMQSWKRQGNRFYSSLQKEPTFLTLWFYSHNTHFKLLTSRIVINLVV